MHRHFRILVLISSLYAAGCGGGSDDGFISPPVGVVPPLAADDTYSVLGNGLLNPSSAQGILANDSPNGAPASLTSPPARGSLTLNPDGSFLYSPNPDQANVSDSFRYTLSNADGSSTATVTIQIGERGFFVDNSAASSGSGSQSSPFRTLAEAAGAAAGVDGAQIVLFRGDGTTTGLDTPLTLGNRQGLCSLDPANPATLVGPIVLTQGNTLADLQLRPSSGSGPVVNATNASDGTLTGLNISDHSAVPVWLADAVGTWQISNSTFQNGFAGVAHIGNTGSLTWSMTNCTFFDLYGAGVIALVRGSSESHLTLRGSQVTSGQPLLVVQTENTALAGLNVTDNHMDGVGIASRGIDIITDDDSRLNAVITANNVTGCATTGAQISSGQNSRARYRLEDNLLSGNTLGGLLTSSLNASDLGLLLRRNQGSLRFEQADTASVKVGNRDQLETTLGNSGPVTTAGTVDNVDPATLDLP